MEELLQKLEEWIKKFLDHAHTGTDSQQIDYNNLRNAPTGSGVVAARMNCSTSQTISDGNITKVALDTIDYQAGITCDTSGFRFTVPSAGYYHIYAQILYGAPNTDQKVINYIVKNSVSGNPISRNTMFVYNPGTAMFLGPTVDDVLSLIAGDTIEIWTLHTYATAPNLNLQGTYSYAFIHKL